MKKIVFCVFFFLTGCVMEPQPNPYDNYSAQQLTHEPAQNLCIATNNQYIPNHNVLNELRQRGYRDCSSAELFCRESVGLVFGTQEFANCRIQRAQLELNAAQYQLNASQAAQQAYYQNRALEQAREPSHVYVHPGYW